MASWTLFLAFQRGYVDKKIRCVGISLFLEMKLMSDTGFETLLHHKGGHRINLMALQKQWGLWAKTHRDIKNSLFFYSIVVLEITLWLKAMCFFSQCGAKVLSACGLIAHSNGCFSVSGPWWCDDICLHKQKWKMINQCFLSRWAKANELLCNLNIYLIFLPHLSKNVTS